MGGMSSGGKITSVLLSFGGGGLLMSFILGSVFLEDGFSVENGFRFIGFGIV